MQLAVSNLGSIIVMYSTGFPVNASQYKSHSLSNSFSPVPDISDTHIWVYVPGSGAYGNQRNVGTTPAAPSPHGPASRAVAAPRVGWYEHEADGTHHVSRKKCILVLQSQSIEVKSQYLFNLNLPGISMVAEEM